MRMRMVGLLLVLIETEHVSSPSAVKPSRLPSCKKGRERERECVCVWRGGGGGCDGSARWWEWRE